MSSLSIKPTYQIFTDIDGQPLEYGYVWIGAANLDPQTNPIQVYLDAALTIPAAQPIRTLDGYLSMNGSPANIYVAQEYSIRVMNKNGTTVYSALNGSSDRLSSAQISYLPAGTGAVTTTLQAKLRQTVSVKDFGAVGNGVADDTAAFEALVTYCAANGALGLLPAGTYLINPSIRTFTASVPFVLRGDGRELTILKNRNTASSFIYWTGADGASFENLTIDGSFTGLPSVPTSGGTLVFVNSNNNEVRNVDIINIWRVAILAFNDHQTTLTNVYSGFVADGVRVYGPSNYINDVGPSAILIADYDNSRIQNCYIENIGQYGYEYKNDCNNNLIDNCVSVNAYRAIYFGGDGANTERLYVKNSIVSNCIVVDATEAIVLGLTKNSIVRNCEFRTTTSGPTYGRAAISIESSSNASITGILVVNRKTFACDIRNVSSGNIVEFSLADDSYTGEAVAINADSLGNSATISWKNHDTSVLNRLRFQSQNNVTDIRAKYFYRYSQETNPRIEDALTYNRPSFASTSKGRVQFGDTFDVFTCTNQASLYEYFGDYTTPALSVVRHKFDTGSKIETIFAAGGGSSVSYLKDQLGFTPGSDNTLRNGSPSFRWSVIYAGTGTINTSDEREKQQILNLSDAERAVSVRLKSLIRTFKFNDAVKEKGDGARIHVGVIAQEVIKAFESEGLDAKKYAVICYDEWKEIPEERDETGNITQAYRPAGNRYGVRYDQLLAFIIGAM